jgi:hypothetical protein
MERLMEDAGQSFWPGTPLIFNATNGAAMAPTSSSTPTAALLTTMIGIAKEFGFNLPTPPGYGVPLGTGLGVTPPPAGVIPAQGGGPTFGVVPNMPGASNFTRPVFNDGRTGIVLAIPDTVFYAQVGVASGNVTPPAQSEIGLTYGLTLDADGRSWFVDRTKTTTALGASLKIVGLDQWDKARGVLFTFLPTVAQLLA